MRRAACGHTDGELVSSVPGVVPAPVTVSRVDWILVTELDERPLSTAPSLEPPTAPPRSFSA